MNGANEIKAKAARFTKFVEWSAEDRCFIGRCPGLFSGGVHGNDEAKVYRELCETAEEWVQLLHKDGEAPSVRRKLATTADELQAERDGLLPVWIRSPKSGPEHYTGFSRAKLYQLAGEGKIRSVSIREPGKARGTRLFNLGSILDFIAKCEANAGQEDEA